MEGECIITDVQDFVQSYMPFEPTDVDVDAFVNSPSGKETITRDADQCLRFTEPRCRNGENVFPTPADNRRQD
jgi:hypothetical protein